MIVRDLLMMAVGGLLVPRLKDTFKGRRHGISSLEFQDMNEKVAEYRKETGDYTSNTIEAYKKMRIKRYREYHNDYTSDDDTIWHDYLRYR